VITYVIHISGFRIIQCLIYSKGMSILSIAQSELIICSPNTSILIVDYHKRTMVFTILDEHASVSLSIFTVMPLFHLQ